MGNDSQKLPLEVVNADQRPALVENEAAPLLGVKLLISGNGYNLPTSGENPFIGPNAKKIGRATRQMIEKQGTATQRKWLEEWRFAQLSPEQQEKQRQFVESLRDKPKAPDSTVRLDEAKARLFRTLHKISVGPSIPPDEMYNAARTLIWEAYKAQVMFETGEEPKMTGREELITAMHQLAHWLVGQEPRRVNGEEPKPEDWLCQCENNPVRLIPIRKSLYIWGPLGTAKSSLALAASYASNQLQNLYNTGMNLRYTSLDEMIVSVYSKQSLAPVEAAAKGSMVLDEMRTQHIGYKHFGNDVRILADILLVRHHAWKQNGAQTIITSNIPPQNLTKMLNDERIDDRMVQQYADILIGGESFRRTNDATPTFIAPASAPQNQLIT